MPRIWPTAPRGEADGERSTEGTARARRTGDRLLHAWQILARSRRSARQPAMLAVEAERWLPPDPPSNALATERSQLLAAVRAATNEVLSRGLADGLRCDASAVRRLCFTLEVAGAHQLLPPFFALQPPGLWHALQQCSCGCATRGRVVGGRVGARDARGARARARPGGPAPVGP